MSVSSWAIRNGIIGVLFVYRSRPQEMDSIPTRDDHHLDGSHRTEHESRATPARPGWAIKDVRKMITITMIMTPKYAAERMGRSMTPADKRLRLAPAPIRLTCPPPLGRDRDGPSGLWRRQRGGFLIKSPADCSGKRRGEVNVIGWLAERCRKRMNACIFAFPSAGNDIGP